MAARVAIVGGGFTGAAAAVQLVRASPTPIAITILEPREELGRGMAYTAPDPDHRLNGNSDNHVLDLADPGELNRWCSQNDILRHDPEAMARNGNIFIRRHDFGRFVGDRVREHASWHTGSSIRHVHDVAIDASLEGDGVRVVTAAGNTTQADLLIVATGNAAPRLPSPVAETVGGHPRVITNPLSGDRIRAIPAAARVLLLGTGLTALDVASTLVRAGHHGGITAISRRGLRPQSHRLAAATTGPTLLERVEGPVPEFVRDALPRGTARGLLRALRQRIRVVEREGGEWYAAFDAMRDVVWQFWPRVPAEEKRRFHRWLRGWYDTRRFRAPPQNDAMVRAAEAEGRVEFRAGRIVDVVPRGERLEVRFRARAADHDSVERFDYLVNCTGLDPASGARQNPFLCALLNRGHLVVDASGMGFAVDAACRPIGAHGQPIDALRVLGPPSAGTFGDPLGVLFIAPQIRRAVPAMLATLARDER